MTPILSYLILNGQLNTACGVFVLAGLTDLLDGYIARNVPGQKSAFGSFMDPLADKLLVSTMFISLTVVQLMPLPLTVIVFLRDITLIIAAFYVRYISLPPPRTFYRYFDATHATSELRPTLISKWNTALQLSTVALTLVSPVLGLQDNWLLPGLCWLTAGTTVEIPVICSPTSQRTFFKGYCNGAEEIIRDRCCIIKKKNLTKIIGFDFSNNQLNSWDILKNISNHRRDVEILLMDNNGLEPLQEKDLVFKFEGFIRLENLTLPLNSLPNKTCPGGKQFWLYSNISDNKLTCQGIVDVCTDPCPENSECHRDGPGLRLCLCMPGFHGYKCLKEGKFKLPAYLGSLLSAIVATSGILWFTQRRKIIKRD
ncbi:DgyrCDS3462 [Dimorphilus gyrociliatus]|uniref:DgyrCDS3462 n=1 Tax=Dimorphilus gyrociliatus TaxID=2664684 RepID=A0A7I8VDU6_9ANNE|nr:DgyrCDS3462 [Dimorphilus gyrociliatus]